MRKDNVKHFVSAIITLAMSLQPIVAQTTPFLSDDEIRMISNEISGDRAFETIRWLSHYHRDSGMDGFFKAADYMQQAAKEAGLEDVHFVEQTMGGPNYTAKSAELWMVEPVELKLADIAEQNVYLADGSHSANVTAELIYIGNASEDAVKNLDVKGKIVLTSGSPGAAAKNAVYAKGAVGIVTYQTSESKSMLDYPDQIAWNRIGITPPDGKDPTFAFSISPRKGETLRKILETTQPQDFFGTGKKTKGGRVVLKAMVETEIGKAPGRTGFVEAWIRGTKYHDQQIIVTAHLQEEKSSANDDGSGCANVLEIGRTLAKLIKDGKIPRPLRDIRFWWTDEISSEYTYFKEHPEDTKNFLANVHQDMVGANQAMGSRVQHLIFAPHSRTSYLDAIFESIGNYVILTNNAFLSASRQGGLPRPHTRPLYSTRGSRQGYSARFIPWFGSSDHMTFLEGAVGVPAVAMINWDDDYIHSSDDDLDKIDATQLRRNAFINGSIAYVLAFAEAKDIPIIAGETFAQGLKRLANDFEVSVRLLKENKDSTDDRWKEVTGIIEKGVEREVRALNSARVFAAADRNGAKAIDELADQMKKKEDGLIGDLRTFYKRLRGSDPNSPKLSPVEVAVSKKIPVNVTPLKKYFDNRGNVQVQTKLHGLMRDEVFNFVDGKRSYYDIYKAAYAEAAAAGSWYYWTVSLDDVIVLLDAAVKAEVLTLR
jgi:Zn-dependent M28 family amino/carboxypeptidase